MIFVRTAGSLSPPSGANSFATLGLRGYPGSGLKHPGNTRRCPHHRPRWSYFERNTDELRPVGREEEPARKTSSSFSLTPQLAYNPPISLYSAHFSRFTSLNADATSILRKYEISYSLARITPPDPLPAVPHRQNIPQNLFQSTIL